MKLNKLIEQYETENPNKPKAIQWMNRLISYYNELFVEWFVNRPTCGVEQRKFLDEIEKGALAEDSFGKGIYIKEYSFMYQEDFSANLSKVIKGE